MQTFIGVRLINHELNAVFRLNTASRGEAFMRVARPPYNVDKHAIVEVDAERFLNLWRSPISSHLDIASNDPTSWPSDYKFHHAEQGFQQGGDNPVPLATIDCYQSREDTYETRRRLFFFKHQALVAPAGTPAVGFINGVTRTIWLLANGAKVFPVDCHSSGADLLQHLAGVSGGRVINLAHLVPSSM